jgi:hypothetical protein
MPLVSEFAILQWRCLEFSNSTGDVHCCKECCLPAKAFWIPGIPSLTTASPKEGGGAK